MQGFNFKVEHIPGLINPSDFLSRVLDLPNNPNLYVNFLNIFIPTNFPNNREHPQRAIKWKEIRDKIIEKTCSNTNYSINPDNNILMFSKKNL